MAEEKKDEPGLGFGLFDVLFPFFLPVKGTIWIASKLKGTAEQEVTDESSVQAKLLDLQMRFEMDEISQEVYEEKEAKLLEQLEVIRRYKEERR